jgi:hypothetical protein
VTTGLPEGNATIPLRQGRNVWRLWRTDRDGASRSQVVETVGAAMVQFLRPTGMSDPWDVIRTRTEPPTWRIGAARPVELRALERYESVTTVGPPMGTPRERIVLADRMHYPGGVLPTVRGQHPWWVLLDVWWRKPDTTIPWPGFAVGLLGNRYRTVVDADWVLERAEFVPAAAETLPDPGDATSAEEHTERAAAAVLPALPWGLLLLGGLALYEAKRYRLL